MSIAIISATLLFLVLAALLLNLNLYSPWHWTVKAAATILTFGTIVATYMFSDRLLGWPTDQSMPTGSYTVLAASIEEPNKRSGSAGAIYLWVRTTDDTTGVVEPPRAYRLAYDRRLHQATIKAMRRHAQGRQQGVNTNGKDGRDLEYFDLDRQLPPKRTQ